MLDHGHSNKNHLNPQMDEIIVGMAAGEAFLISLSDRYIANGILRFNNLLKFLLYLFITFNPVEKFKFIEPYDYRILYNFIIKRPKIIKLKF